ncbi:MAG TPA: AmmeMemoRadiSam system protein B, partial [Polyangiaceae bacterium]|nr:AmmeMemoRadiSam system protein B [Polyangiaceae bacterium]
MVDARKPAAAGVFYPAEPEILARTVRELLDAVPPSKTSARAARVRAVVVPHGLLGPAGAVAAAAWARVATQAARFRRVVLLGPAHHTQFVGIAAPFADTFATPLGAVDVDRIAVEVLRRFPQLLVSDDPHEQEPSLEVQLPFVQTVLPNTTIVPLLVGEIEDADAAEILDALWVEETLVVVSTDLSHYYDAVTAKRLDEATARSIEALDADAIREEQACGHSALRGLLTAARGRKLRASKLDVRHSGEVSGE